MKKLFVALLPFLLLACSKGPSHSYTIGIDPTWYPLELGQSEVNVFAFVDDLLEAVGRKEGIAFKRITRSWDNLVQGLEERDYDVILSPMRPLAFNNQRFSFTNPFLTTGPVLVIPKKTKMNALEDFDGKRVGVEQYSDAEMILERHPLINIAQFTSIPAMLEDLVTGEIQGALVPRIQARAYVADLFDETLHIAGNSLNDSGLRMVALKDKQQKLLKSFEEGVESLKRNGEYEKLLLKWSL